MERRKADFQTLSALTRAHLTRIPFENISKLYYWKTQGVDRIVSLPEYLDGIGRFHFGGTCFNNNYHLHELLLFLGFETSFCGADMSRPDMHVLNIVRCEGRKYIVDVGFAAPFYDPLPIDHDREYRIDFGPDRYTVKPDNEHGRSEIDLERYGDMRDGYRVNPAPRAIGEFAPNIADSYSPSSMFMNTILLVKFGDESCDVIRNYTYRRMTRTAVHQEELTSRDRVIDAIEIHFGIPSEIVRTALDGVALRMPPCILPQ